jgi:hypothetical protein
VESVDKLKYDPASVWGYVEVSTDPQWWWKYQCYVHNSEPSVRKILRKVLRVDNFQSLYLFASVLSKALGGSETLLLSILCTLCKVVQEFCLVCKSVHSWIGGNLTGAHRAGPSSGGTRSTTWSCWGYSWPDSLDGN